MSAEHFHHQHGVDCAAAKSAVRLGKRQRQQSQFGVPPPHRLAVTERAAEHRFTLLKAILLRQQAFNAIL